VHWTVTAILLTAHLLLVDVAMFGPLMAVWFDWRARRESQQALGEFGRRLAWISVWGLVAGGVLGGVLLAIRYLVDERYFRALAVVPRDRLWFAGAEWLFALVCLVLYAASWRRWQRVRVVHGLVAIAAASNLLIHFPMFFVAVSVIRMRPALLDEPLTRGGYRRLLVDPEVLARVLHLWLAAAAVTGLVIVWVALSRRPFGNLEIDQQAELRGRVLKLGGRVAMTAVMLQFPTGLWVALVLPERSRQSLMGTDGAATLLFLGSVGLAMLLMNLLSALILGERKRELARRSTVVLFMLMLLMVAVRLRSAKTTAFPEPNRSSKAATAIRSRAAPLASRETSGSMESPANYPPRPVSEDPALKSLECVTISDPVHGSKAKILPGLGFNCYGFVANTPMGPLEILWSAPDFTDGTAKPTGSGIPLMFPFAGRIRGAQFNYDGKTYTLDAADGLGNAIHGFVFNRPWRVKSQEKDRVIGEFQASVDEESLLKLWPADFRITVEYRIAGNTLSSEILIENPDEKPLPFTFGTHAYFRIPLGGGSADDCIVKVPVTTNWELSELLPTGLVSPSPNADKLAAGIPAGEMRFDNVFGGLKFENHRLETSIQDPHSGRRVTQEFDDEFTACVVFNPPHREAVCMEPYTGLPDPFALLEKGVEPHLRVLGPGESFRTRIEIRVD
jgi:aldose 1-epimerase